MTDEWSTGPGAAGIAGQLRQWRTTRAMSQAELARQVHYTKSYVSKVENGHKPATVDFARRCDEVLDTGGALAAVIRPARPRARWPRPAQLPRAVAGFTGRQPEFDRLDEVARAAARTGSGTLVVLTGPAGVGKTALAVQWGHRIASRFPDGALFAELSGYGPREPVPSTAVLDGLLRALDTVPARIPLDEAARAALFRSLLDGRHLLLVLDNAASAEQVRPLLPGTAGCLVLVTSRSALSGLVARDGATRLVLAPLPEADAVELLRHTVGEDRVRDEPEAAVRIAAYCAGLPLALRVAGDRAATRPRHSLAALAGQLAVQRDRLDLLAAEEDEATAVRGVLSWSYARLPAGAAAALCRLGTVAGADIGLPAAAALTGTDGPETRRALDELTGVHLLEETWPGRYRLHDLVRAYAAEQAPLDRVAALRLLSWYLHTAAGADALLIPQRRRLELRGTALAGPPLDFADRDEALRWYDTERVNLVPAVGWAVDLKLDLMAWQLAATLAGYFMVAKHWTPWIETHRAGLDAARRLGDRDAEAMLLSSLGAAYGDSGRLPESIGCLRESLALRRASGDPAGQAATLLNLGVALAHTGDHPGCVSCFVESLALFRRAGDAYGEGMVANNLADAYLHLGRLDEAEPLLAGSLEVFAAQGNGYGEAMARSSLGELYRMRGRLAEAARELHTAMRLRVELGDRHGEAYNLLHLGDVLLDRGAPEEAAQHWQRSLAIFEELAAPPAAQARARLAALDR